MAGYIGNKAVGLNVTTGDILGDVGVGGDIDVDGTANLDVVDIDGAVDMASTLQLDGAITLGVAGASNGFINSPSGIFVNIDSDNNQTDRFFDVRTNSADGSGALLFQVLETGAATIANGLTLTDGNLVVGTADHGIQFSASTKNAGTSSVSNLMKDYEIGVWTPHLDNGGSITVHSAFYVRTGDLVHVQGFVTVTPTNNSSLFAVGGLPFLSLSGNSSYGSISISYWGNMDLAAPNFIVAANQADSMYLHLNSGSSSAVSNANIISAGSTRSFIFGGTYRTAQ